MVAGDIDRSSITLQDHVDAVVASVDSAVAAASGAPVVLVGHSAGCGVAHAAVDARPDKVGHVVHVAGFPIGDGVANPGGYPAVGGEVPFPDWSAFEEADLADLDDAAREELRSRAVPVPVRVHTDLQRLSDDRRYGVPITVVCTEFTSAMLREWVDQAFEPVQELSRIEHVDYVDLPTGHWPMFTKPTELADIILAAAG
jgi:pimeloyl-ACP methyl ester carboxylesterase